MTSLRGVSSATEVTSSSLVITAPAGIAAGDLILVFAASQYTSTTGLLPGFSTSGLNEAGTTRGQAYWRTATGTEGGTTFTIPIATATYIASAICAVYAGPASIDPLPVPPVYGDGSTLPAIAVPAIALSGSSDWLAWFGASGLWDSTTSTTLTLPPGFTSQETVPFFTGGGGGQVMAFGDIETAQAAGSTGTQTGSVSPSKRSTGWMLGIAPVAAASSGSTAGLLAFA